MNVLTEVRQVIQDFPVTSESAGRIHLELLRLVNKLTFDENTGLVVGPRIDIASIARGAGVARKFISHERCELPDCRSLILQVMNSLSSANIRAELDSLKEENKRLKRRIDIMDSENANSLMPLWKNKKEGVESAGRRASSSPEELRASLRIVSTKLNGVR